jgi:hypothetical protein
MRHFNHSIPKNNLSGDRKVVINIPTPPPFNYGVVTISDSEEVEARNDNLETQIQLVTDSSVPEYI